MKRIYRLIIVFEAKCELSLLFENPALHYNDHDCISRTITVLDSTTIFARWSIELIIIIMIIKLIITIQRQTEPNAIMPNQAKLLVNWNEAQINNIITSLL